MHNQETAKDDMLEAIFGVIQRMNDYFKRLKKEDGLETEIPNESSPETNEVKISNFQKAMKDIIESDADKRVKEIAQTFYDHPKDSMKMLQSIISKQAIDQANELVNLTGETSKAIQSIRNSIDMNKPNAMDQISILNQLEKRENQKSVLANNILKELKPLEKEEEQTKELSADEKREKQSEYIVREETEIDEPER